MQTTNILKNNVHKIFEVSKTMLKKYICILHQHFSKLIDFFVTSKEQVIVLVPISKLTLLSLYG